MKNKNILFSGIGIMLLLLSSYMGICQTQTFVGNDIRSQRLVKTIVSTNGQHISIGNESDAIDFSTSNDGIILSTDPVSGIVNWEHRLGFQNGRNDNYTDLVELANGDFLAIGFMNHNFDNAPAAINDARAVVTYIFSNGIHNWTRSYEFDNVGNGEGFFALTYDGVNTIYVAGSNNFNANTAESMVASINTTTGAVNWSERYSHSTTSDELYEIELANGRLYVFGVYYNGPTNSTFFDISYLHLDAATGNVIQHQGIEMTQFLNGMNLTLNRPKHVFINSTAAGDARFLLSGLLSNSWTEASNTNFVIGGDIIGGAIQSSVPNPLTSRLYENNDPALFFDNDFGIVPTNVGLTDFILVQNPANQSFIQANSVFNTTVISNSTISEIQNFGTLQSCITLGNPGSQSFSGIAQPTPTNLILSGYSAFGSNQQTTDAYITDMPFPLPSPTPNSNLCPIINDTINILTPTTTLRTTVLTLDTLPLIVALENVTTTTLETRDACIPCSDFDTRVIASDITILSSQLFTNEQIYVAPGITITVAAGAVLDLTNTDIAFGECARIFVDGGSIRANNAVFRPCDENETWQGIDFSETSSSIIDECTFKNALVALDFDDASARINNNYFQNCQYGISAFNSTFANPITGNNFVYDANYFGISVPVACTPPSGQYAIYSKQSTFTSDISKNIFTNGTNSDGLLEGIYAKKSTLERVSSNRFTNFTRAIDYTDCYEGSMEIMNNTIEDVFLAENYLSQIYLIQCSANISILGNTLSSSRNVAQNSGHHGIELMASSNVSIKQNDISGFNSGIVLNETSVIQVLNNTIFDPIEDGLYAIDGAVLDIRCNEVDMNHKGIGMQIENCYETKVLSNCILNTDYAVYFGSSNGNIIQSSIDFYNNYLYNYEVTGVQNSELLNLQIGIVGSKNGQNTFWSNKGNGVVFDVYTDLILGIGATTVYNNYFDIPTFNGPETNLFNTTTYYSTASCGHQIVDRDNKASYSREYDCDNLESEPSHEKQAPESMNSIVQSENPVGMAVAYFSAYNNNQMENRTVELHKLLQSSKSLDKNTKAWISFYKYYLTGENMEASARLNALNPITAEENRMKSYYTFTLKYDGKKIQGISDPMLGKFASNNAIVDRFTNLEAPILTMNGIDANYYITPIPEAAAPSASSIMQRMEQEEFLVYPNPTKGVVNMKIVNTESTNAILKVYTIEGKEVQRYNLEMIEGVVQADLSKLDRGTYLITLTSSDFSKSRKIVLE